MIDIREHGGSFGGGGRKPIFNAKVVKQIVRAPFTRSGNGSTQTRLMTETANYLWYWYNDDDEHIIRVNKSNLTDVDHVNMQIAYTPLMLVPLYEQDKVVVVTAATNTAYILNADLTYAFNANLWPNAISDIRNYYYDHAAKRLYLFYANGNSRSLMAINVTTISAPTVIYNLTLLSTADAISFTYTAFEPNNNAVRILHTVSGGYVNRRYSLIDGSVIATYANPTLIAGLGNVLLAIDRTDYSKVYYVNSNGISKIDLNTNTLVASKSATAVRTEVSAFFPNLLLNVTQNPIPFVKRLPNGNYFGFQSIFLNTSVTYDPEDYIAFVFDSSLNIIHAEPSQETYGLQPSTSLTDMNNYHDWMFSMANYGSPVHFLK